MHFVASAPKCTSRRKRTTENDDFVREMESLRRSPPGDSRLTGPPHRWRSVRQSEPGMTDITDIDVE